MTDTAVRLDRHERVAELVLCDPDHANTINMAWADDFLAAASDIGDEDHVVLLRAEGRNFSFGGNVAGFVGEGAAERIGRLADALHDGLKALAAVEVPVVTAVQGWATGAGMSLALAGDVIILAEGARFKTAYNALGFTADGGMTHHLPRKAPPALVRDLLFTDRVLTAPEALAAGMVSRVVPDDDLLDTARDVAATIAAMSRPAVVAVGELLAQSPTTPFAAQLDDETRRLVDAAGSPDGIEGVTAFLEKRPPRFGEMGTPVTDTLTTS